MSAPTRRTKDLTEEEIKSFNREELQHWMNRVMMRLFQLVDRATYDRMTKEFILLSKGGDEFIKKGLIQLVAVIKARWQDAYPPLRAVK